MPENSDFVLKLLVGNSSSHTILPEYVKGDVCYVECNLFTPYSFMQKTEELFNGEIEKQEKPVTPFSISIQAKMSTGRELYYRIFIDGQKVVSKSVKPGEQKIIKGFRDGTSVREFLFSLPTLEGSQFQTSDTRDRVGWIDVECWNATIKSSKRTIRNKQLQFSPANKKESIHVTQGKHMMTTTKAGRILSLRNMHRQTDFWNLVSLRSKLSVKYITAQALEDLGIKTVPIPFPFEMVNQTCLTNSGSISMDLTQGLQGTPYDSAVLSQVLEGTSTKCESQTSENVGNINLLSPEVKVEVEIETDDNVTDKQERSGSQSGGSQSGIRLSSGDCTASSPNDNDVIVLD